ncbi:OmpA family protein [Caenispirillum salinarum]|uniref:OmpA family protein n=1 Tax=Caenispirillum salinarum TaxID=859058 RepID=UPI00384EA00C
MHPIIRVAVPAVATVTLAACANPYMIEDAKQVTPQGSQFTQSLAKNYSDFTRFESDEMYDWPDADHFARKTLAAAEGRRVAPEDPRDWDIDNAEWRADLRVARNALVTAYRDGAREKNPVVAASAQSNYDCWVEQSEEGWQMDHIAECREGFINAMNQLGERPAPQPAQAQAPVLVFFDFDVARVPSEADPLLNSVAEVAQENPNLELQVVGHADRAGSVPYNNRLSEQRARNVAQALSARGVPMDRMSVDWKGELDPRVPTGDGVREPENRRVVIRGMMTGDMMSMSGGAGGMNQTAGN